MRWRSVSFKLFAVTSLVFIGWLTAMMALQLAFFEPYYVRQKTNDFVQEFNRLRDRIMESTPSAKVVPPYFGAMESKYYAVSAILEFTGDGIRISLSKKADQSSRKFISVLPNPAYGDSLLSPITQPMPDADMSKLVSALSDWMKDQPSVKLVMEQGQTVKRYSQVSLPSMPGSKQLLVIAPLQVNNGIGTVLVSSASLQPVGDAIAAFKGFFPYFYLLAAVGAVMLVLLYSRMITRPLSILNGTAMRLAKLDFRVKSSIRSKDEIGNLSQTLNFLSDNLQTALAELQEANDKLHEDIEKEKKLDRLRREFVAGVSHELKTPVSLIGGYAEALRDNVGDGRKRERYTSIILEETSRMAGMVNDMLDLSQLEAGQYRLQLETVELDEIIRNVAAKLQDREAGIGDGQAARTQPLIETELLPAVVQADRFRLEQVLSNLLGNALRHTRRGGRLGVRMELLPDIRVRVVVWNEGDPIPVEELDAIWNHFHRVEKSRHRDSGGTGIGLAIVKQILLLHGAEYGVRNTAAGVEFSWSLPLSQALEQQ
jgi:two-component system, OmpR family, sensor histidine kinase VanS